MHGFEAIWRIADAFEVLGICSYVLTVVLFLTLVVIVVRRVGFCNEWRALVHGCDIDGLAFSAQDAVFEHPHV